MYQDDLFDLTDYVYSQEMVQSGSDFEFLNADIVSLISQQSGQDVTKRMQKILDGLDASERSRQMNCLKNNFYQGKPDFRKTARCQANGYVLLALSIILASSMGLKCMCFTCAR